MKKLAQNITNIFGEHGKTWLASLPAIVDILSAKWSLNKPIPVDNMSFNYVAKAITHAGQPVVLKISCDGKSIADEQYALKYLAGCASIRIIDHDHASEKYSKKWCVMVGY